MRETKQVIVIRKDLKMRRGKEIAQGCHASLGAVLGCMQKIRDHIDGIPLNGLLLSKHVVKETPLYEWLEGLFTKVVLYCESEEELLGIYNEAKDRGLVCSLIEDSGKTEFGGVATITCCAIGPGWTEEVDKITGHLQLY